MHEYPYFNPIILSDDVFVAYGGEVGDSTSGQRNAAYMIAEIMMTSHLGTFLKPTIVTGTYAYSSPAIRPVELEYGYVRSVNSVVFNSISNACACILQGLDGCVFIDNDYYGYVFPFTNKSVGQCGCNWNAPYQVRIAYEAGLSTGTSMLPPVLNALTIMADVALKDMIDPHANEGVGDIGVQRWSSMGYSEDRVKLANTALGTSARANRAMKLVEWIKRKKALRL